MSWDGFQREVLAEFGHVLLALPGQAQAAPVAETTPAPAASIPAAHADAQVDAAMLQRLAQVAGCSPQALLAAFADSPDALAVTGNPAAKRALWPRLRALRRRP